MEKGRSGRIFSGTRARFFLLLLLQLGILSAVMLLRTAFLLFHTTGIFYWKVFYQRGLPLVIGGSILCLLLCGLILFRSRTSLGKSLREDRGKWLITGILLMVGIAAGIFISKTRLGLEKENAFWGKPTVPLLEWHILLAFALCLVWFCISNLTQGKIPERILLRTLCKGGCSGDGPEGE